MPKSLTLSEAYRKKANAVEDEAAAERFREYAESEDESRFAQRANRLFADGWRAAMLRPDRIENPMFILVQTGGGDEANRSAGIKHRTALEFLYRETETAQCLEILSDHIGWNPIEYLKDNPL
jgi:hypothetical protein